MRRPPKKEDANLDLEVFGYSSRLFPHSELEGRDENSFLIPWQDEDKLLIDRYDCRVFLQDLSEKTIGSTSKNDIDEFADKIEEELCDEERYKDLKASELERAKEEQLAKRGKAAEIAFNYDAAEKDENDELSGESDEEDEEAYEPPIKLPLGINMPPTAKLGHIIERTANFVALQGNQMEIIIKAKHREHKDRFGFLEFDHPLNSFYKYILKLIREKKYTPLPRKRKLLPGEHTAQERPLMHETDEDSDSDGGDYLHPLLLASKSRGSTTTPSIPVPVASSKANPYVSIYESLYATEPVEKKPKPSTSKKEQPPNDLPKSDPVETDPMEIHNYSIWHQSFYNRPSVFSSGSLPKHKIPPADILSQINVAAKYVAFNGAHSERHLLEHNRGRLSFLYPSSEYLVYYHNKLRFFLSRLNFKSVPCVYSKYHREMELEFPRQIVQPAPPPDDSKFASFEHAALPIPAAPTPPEVKTLNTEPASTYSDEEVKKKRKERAQQFMADIIRKKKTDLEEGIEPSAAIKNDVAVPADAVIPSLINTLVSDQLEKLKSSTRDSEHPKKEERRKEHKKHESGSGSESPKHRRSRSPGRSRRRSSRERHHKHRRRRHHRS